MYEQSARVYDALCAHKDYAAAGARLHDLIERLTPGARTLLDVACGTGRHLEHLRRHYDVEGLDRSAHMLDVARDRCPGVALHAADLVDFDLGRTFDVVCCLFGSVAYAKTLAGLERTVRGFARHTRPGGLVIIEPWLTPERFIEGKLVFDEVRDDDLAVARMYVTRREGALSIYDSHYLVGEGTAVTHFTEREELGLFTDGEYLHAIGQAGLTPADPGDDLFGYGLFAAVG